MILDYAEIARAFSLVINQIMSNANLAITTAGQADSSLAMILATAGAMIDEINPAMKTIKERLKENVLKTVMGPYGTTDDAA